MNLKHNPMICLSARGRGSLPLAPAARARGVPQ
jgi:hypothetical protein